MINSLLIIVYTIDWSEFGLFLMFYQKVNQSNGGIFHLNYDGFNLCNQIVVEQLEDNGNDQTTDSCNQRNLHTVCNECRRDVTSNLDSVKCENEADNCTEEAKHRSDGNEEGDP